MNGDPFIGMFETPVTSSPLVAGFLSNLPAYRTQVSPLLRGTEIGLAHGFLVVILRTRHTSATLLRLMKPPCLDTVHHCLLLFPRTGTVGPKSCCSVCRLHVIVASAWSLVWQQSTMYLSSQLVTPGWPLHQAGPPPQRGGRGGDRRQPVRGGPRAYPVPGAHHLRRRHLPAGQVAGRPEDALRCAPLVAICQPEHKPAVRASPMSVC